MKQKISYLKPIPVALIAALLLLISAKAFARQDSCHIRISLLTATPGEELYETWGHSALRITDSIRNTDIVYNYGTFNFDTPDFYLKFIKGKLPFYLSPDYFQDFVTQYEQDSRGVTEQVLNLTCAEKQNILMLLEVNMMGNNRGYKYEFTFDNCTTRLRDLIEKATDSSIHFGQVIHTKVTFRNLIHEYLNYNDNQWSKLGIDILLGSKLDANPTPYQVMFLPDYLMETLDSTTLNGQPLVSDKHALFKKNYSGIEKNNLTHPFFLFVCLFVLVAFLSFSNSIFIKKTLSAFDGFLFFITGLLGILLLFMWFGTDHIMCANNYNLLWAWPANVITAFYIHSKKKWPKIYFTIYAIFNIALIALWATIPQHLNAALIPIIAILIFRSLIYIFRKK